MALPTKALLTMEPRRGMRVKLFINRNGGPIFFQSPGLVNSEWLRKQLNPPMRIDAIWVDQLST